MSSLSHTARSNRLLVALPSDELDRLIQGSERVRINSGRILFDAGERVRHAYFPLSGMISLLSTTHDGKSVEVAIVGSEGLIGLPLIVGNGDSPYQAMVQLPLEAIKVSASAIRAGFERGGRFRELILGQAMTRLAQVTQSVSCQRFHTVEQRLARWLLMTRDRAGADNFRLTQEFLSFMLGAPRTSVTAFAASMQREGLISYSRGVITILDSKGLEAVSCDCYGIVQREIERNFAA